MKKLVKLSLRTLNDSELQKREMNALRGGTDACGCDCAGGANKMAEFEYVRDNVPGGSQNCSCGCYCQIPIPPFGNDASAYDSLFTGAHDY